MSCSLMCFVDPLFWRWGPISLSLIFYSPCISVVSYTNKFQQASLSGRYRTAIQGTISARKKRGLISGLGFGYGQVCVVHACVRLWTYVQHTYKEICTYIYIRTWYAVSDCVCATLVSHASPFLSGDAQMSMFGADFPEYFAHCVGRSF